MEKKKLLLLGVLGVVSVLGFMQLQNMNKPAPIVVDTTSDIPRPAPVQATNFTDVLVAVNDIPMGSRILAPMLEWRKWPSEAVGERMIDINVRPAAIDEISSAVARTAIYAGEPIVDRKVVQTGERGQMSALLKPGMRAIATRISVDSAAGGFIQPGDRVDVVLTMQIKNNPAQQQNGGAASLYAANTVFENVNVLAIDQTFGQTPEGQAFVVGSTALLELSQADAEILTEAQSMGELSLTLRSLQNRRSEYVPSAAKIQKSEKSEVSSMTIYRNGQPQTVAIQGQ